MVLVVVRRRPMMLVCGKAVMVLRMIVICVWWMCSAETWPEVEANTNPSRIAAKRCTTRVYVTQAGRSNETKWVREHVAS